MLGAQRKSEAAIVGFCNHLPTFHFESPYLHFYTHGMQQSCVPQLLESCTIVLYTGISAAHSGQKKTGVRLSIEVDIFACHSKAKSKANMSTIPWRRPFTRAFVYTIATKNACFKISNRHIIRVVHNSVICSDYNASWTKTRAPYKILSTFNASFLEQLPNHQNDSLLLSSRTQNSQNSPTHGSCFLVPVGR